MPFRVDVNTSWPRARSLRGLPARGALQVARIVCDPFHLAWCGLDTGRRPAASADSRACAPAHGARGARAGLDSADARVRERNDEGEPAAIDDKRRELPFLGNPVDGHRKRGMDLGVSAGMARTLETDED